MKWNEKHGMAKPQKPNLHIRYRQWKLEYKTLFKFTSSVKNPSHNHFVHTKLLWQPLRSWTTHFANISAITFFICPTNTHNSYKIVKLLKSFKIITVAPTYFGLHKPSSGSSLPVLHQSYNVDIGYIYRYLKLSVVLWLRILFSLQWTDRH